MIFRKPKFVLLTERQILAAIESVSYLKESHERGGVELGGDLAFSGGGDGPEQHELFMRGHQIAYLRLRGGSFTTRVISFTDTAGELFVYAANRQGFFPTKSNDRSNWSSCRYSSVPVKGQGCFEPAERAYFIREALTHVVDYYSNYKRQLATYVRQPNFGDLIEAMRKEYSRPKN